MDSCCEDKASELAQLRDKQSRVLYIVLAINAAMFLVEFVAGWIVGSTALLADSLDMFGDASVYALTLYVLHRSARTRAGAALFKGGFMLLFGLLVIADAVRKMVTGDVPEAEWIGLVGAAALIANTICFVLLYRHRSDDLNMKSTWLCSRNDLIANTSVIAAAILVGISGTIWPDVIVGLAIAVLFLHSARQVLSEAWKEWSRHGTPSPSKPQSAAKPSACCSPQITARVDSCCAPLVAPPTEPTTACQPVAALDSCCNTKPIDSCCGPATVPSPIKGKGE
ncbi:cation transporter [Pseudomonas sp.]|uniref:cation transporter n=1 Tax=Pseudomonas sp. TaxID=306 RepID=UPI0027372B57|nr:cation diffusion facilitator family transporter [Pseudomonas sp.]MDP3814862.1 cation diffusion facilitator family transporter [Pseudomonas sp.]